MASKRLEGALCVAMALWVGPIPAWAQAPAGESGPAIKEAVSPPLAGYHKGFFIRATNGRFDLHLKGRVQTRFAYELADGSKDEFAFSIPRARLTFAGHAWDPSLAYKFQADFGKGSVKLKDFYGDYALMPGTLHVRVGQWKKPFSRQQINSSGRLALIERAITDHAFGAGRDIGIAIHNDIEHSPTFEYALGIFDGTGDKPHFLGDVVVDPSSGEGTVTNGRFSNVPKKMHPAAVLRLGYNYGGIKGYREADIEGGPLRFAIGGSALADFDADADDRSGLRAEADYALKLYGFSSTGAVYLSSAQSGASFMDQGLAAVGFHLQTGYLVADRFQLSARYALVASDAVSRNRHEILGGVSTYFFGHSLKWQLDGGALLAQSSQSSSSDYLLRSQIQVAF